MVSSKESNSKIPYKHGDFFFGVLELKPYQNERVSLWWKYDGGWLGAAFIGN